MVLADLQETIRSYFVDGIIWVIIPLILGSIFGLAIYMAITSSPGGTEERLRNLVGLGVGLAACTLFVGVDGILGPFTLGWLVVTLGNVAWYIVLCLFLGAAFMAGYDYLSRRFKVQSFFVAILTAASLTALYYYGLEESFRNPVMVIALSLIIGGGTYALIVRRMIRLIFRKSQ